MSAGTRGEVQQSLALFDERPMELHSFRFRARSVQAIGTPTIQQFQHALEFAAACDAAAGLWIGDLMNYAESRADWREKISQAAAVTGLAERTITNRAYIARHVQEPERQVAPSIKHMGEVAALEAPQQRKWLSKANVEGWTAAEMRDEIRASKRRKVIEGQARLEGKFRVIYADPPWRYRNTAGTKGNSTVDHHYPTMSIEELCKLPVEQHAHKNAVLFLWITTPLLLENPGPREVIEAWGFDYASLITWDKVLGNPGRFAHIVTEHLAICERGKCAPDEAQVPKSLFVERRTEHSAKPTGIRKVIERMFHTGPYLELFAREASPNWTAFGNDARLWNQQEAQP